MPARRRTRWRRGTVALGALVLAGLPACTQDRGRPPVARLTVTPRYVPVGVETLVVLDGRRSCDEIDHPETCDKSADGLGPPLTCPGGVSFRWELDGPHTLTGSEETLRLPSLNVRVTLDRPLTVKLTVTDCDQNSVTTQTQIGLILPYPETTPDGGG